MSRPALHASPYGISPALRAPQQRQVQHSRRHKDPPKAHPRENDGQTSKTPLRKTIKQLQDDFLATTDPQVAPFAQEVLSKLDQLDLKEIFAQIDIDEAMKNQDLEVASGTEIFNSLSLGASKVVHGDNPYYNQPGLLAYFDHCLDNALGLNESIGAAPIFHDAEKASLKRELISEFCYKAFDNAKVPEQFTREMDMIARVAIISKLFG